MNDTLQIVVRPVKPEDHNFIFSAWLKGQYFGNSYFRQIPQDLYFEGYARTIAELLSPFHPEGPVTIRIACDEGSPEWISGFSVSRGNDLYWVYVKENFRRQGIATLLIESENIKTAKSTTKAGRAFMDKKGIIFNPL